MKTFRKLGRYTIYTLGVIFAVILVVVGVSAILDVIFRVEPHQQAIVHESGRLKRVVSPGFNWKIPFIEDVYYCDIRPQDLELTAVEAQMSDLTRINIDASASYRIVDCFRFFQTNAGSAVLLRVRLSDILNARLRETLARYSLPDLPHRRNVIGAAVKEQVNTVARSSGAALMDVNLFFSVRQPSARRE